MAGLRGAAAGFAMRGGAAYDFGVATKQIPADLPIEAFFAWYDKRHPKHKFVKSLRQPAKTGNYTSLKGNTNMDTSTPLRILTVGLRQFRRPDTNHPTWQKPWDWHTMLEIAGAASRAHEDRMGSAA